MSTWPDVPDDPVELTPDAALLEGVPETTVLDDDEFDVELDPEPDAEPELED